MKVGVAPSQSPPEAVRGPTALDVSGVAKRFDGATVLGGVDLRVAPDRVVALLGPSGCGKTTLLRIVAGLEAPDAGEVRIGDRLVSGPGTLVPPDRRRVGMVFQDWALFPHLSVGRNVGYGLPKGERRGRRVGDALDMVGLGGFADRMPHTLSGGQKQRVALARALAPAPAALLLDEPFSNLDTTLRAQVRTEVHRLLKELEITTVFVTHDQAEAFVLGDEVAVMHAGRIEQQDSPSRLYAAPATRWVARFVGEANLVAGTAEGEVARTACGPIPLVRAGRGPVEVLVRPEHLRLVRSPAGSGPSVVVELVEYYGHDTVYEVQLDDGPRLRARTTSVPEFVRGDPAVLTYVGGATVAYDGAGDDGGAGDGREGEGRAVAPATGP